MSERPSFSTLREVRSCFSKGKPGAEALRELLVSKIRTPEELLELSKQFDKGIVGRIAFSTIAFRSGCETILGVNEKGNYIMCGKEGKMTLDIDVGGSMMPDTLPMCSDDHLKQTEKSYMNSLKLQGKSGWPSKNGFGRA